ncbi:hypothetical protein BKA70DRAFT_1223860 [Coprinopsis sp. MPI-PUGE-AT-0042]|nr:hypothetical protein BKA70DRAFT_1223860 [Coprinopsis sp. MPI-PUGE-AT-0042]
MKDDDKSWDESLTFATTYPRPSLQAKPLCQQILPPCDLLSKGRSKLRPQALIAKGQERTQWGANTPVPMALTKLRPCAALDKRPPTLALWAWGLLKISSASCSLLQALPPSLSVAPFGSSLSYVYLLNCPLRSIQGLQMFLLWRCAEVEGVLRRCTFVPTALNL